MSVHVMSWVFKHSETTKGDRLVLLAIADHASPDGTDSWASLKTLASEARLSERAVRYCLRSLEEQGAIKLAGTGPRGTHNYTVVMEDLGVQELPGASFAGGQPTAPEPSLTLSEGRSLALVQSQELPHARETRIGRVDRKPVSAEHEQLARSVLNAWNAQTGQTLASRDWLAKIVMRIREHPGMTLMDHEVVIQAALAAPWWDGPASPSVVYGNGACFERSMTIARNGTGPKKHPRRYGRGLTTEEILERTRGLA